MTTCMIMASDMAEDYGADVLARESRTVIMYLIGLTQKTLSHITGRLL